MLISAAEFERHGREGCNRVPLIREVLADLDTPLSAYLKLGQGPCSYLLESVHGGEKWGRYSMIGLPCSTVLRVFGQEATVEKGGAIVERHQVEDPLDFVRTFKSRYRMPDAPLLRFTGGLVGYFGYDTVRFIEPSLSEVEKPDEIGGPDILLFVSDEVVVFDNLAGKLYVVVHADPLEADAYARGLRRLDEIAGRLYEPLELPRPVAPVEVREADFVSGFSQPDFEAAVERIREYIRAGDVMQVVLSQRLSIPFGYRPLDLYRSLRTLNPSPYMYFLDLGDGAHIVGSSPEILARLEGDRVTVRPLAGTRPRGRTEAEDQALEQQLLADEKERAEHLMLIDLGRNDIGRVSEIGSVAVTEAMAIERYSHVMHIISNVTGRLRAGLDAIDVLRATLPAGTLSGAPKVRAMEIIDELEPVKRGVYGGAVGYIGWNGNMDLAIAIRTAVISGGQLYVQAGAGIVADSVARSEWDETMNKGRAMFAAVAMTAKGLPPAGEHSA